MSKFFMDTLFQQIETWYNKPFGSVLDAGTGEHSLQWLLSTQTQSITAITGHPYRKKGLEFSYKEKVRTEDRILHGNWQQDDFLKGECFDIVVADYLLRAIDSFAPYFQVGQPKPAISFSTNHTKKNIPFFIVLNLYTSNCNSAWEN